MNRQKRILIVDENLPYLLNGVNAATGGASVQTYSWLKGFEKLGYELHIGSSLRIENNSGYEIHNTGRESKKQTIIALYITFQRLFRVLWKVRPEFIYISIPYWSNIFLILCSKILRIKVIQRISNDNLVDERARMLFGRKKYFFLVKSLKLSDIICCQNTYQFDNVNEKFKKKKVIKLTNPYVYDPIGLDARTRTKAYIAWIGLFQHQKNLNGLLFIAKNLPNYQIKVAGQEGLNIDKETKLDIVELKKCPNVEFVGLLSRKEIHNFLSKAYCLVNTSHYEGFSNTFLEAFSVGIPVITRKQIDPDFIIQENNLGYVVENINDFPIKIENLIKSNNNYDHIIPYLLTKHDPKVLAQQLVFHISTI